MMDEDINQFVPSLLNPRTVPKPIGDILTQASIVSRCSLSLKRKSSFLNVRNTPEKVTNKKFAEVQTNKENIFTNLSNVQTNNNDDKHLSQEKTYNDEKQLSPQKTIDNCTSIGFSAIDDLKSIDASPVSLSFGEINNKQNGYHDYGHSSFNNQQSKPVTISSATDLIDQDISEKDSDSTENYSLIEKPSVSVSFGLLDTTSFEISTRNNIKNVSVAVKDNITNVDVVMVEGSGSQVSPYKSDSEENVLEEETQTKEEIPSSPKKLPVAVNLEIKNKSLEDSNATSLGVTENSKVLILNTSNATLSHVIVQPLVQPPNYNIVKRQIPNARKLINSAKKRRTSGANDVQCKNKLKQTRIDRFLVRKSDVVRLHGESERTVVNGACTEDVGIDGKVMSRNPVKCDQQKAGSRGEESGLSPRSRVPLPRRESPKLQKQSLPQQPRVKASISDAQRIKSAESSRNNDCHRFNLPIKTSSHQNRSRTPVAATAIPPFKIVAGTHLAVDAFSYGEIQNVKHYFLTHFHSDHYAGLKKTFAKILYCSKITAELCVTRLGVNPKCIRIFNCDETITVDNIEVTAVDANHCPGAIMLIFSLPSGKTILHTGDFRASPLMESYPVFWNREIHTIYLDTTYCNPRYDFPTQEQSLEMALFILREKKVALEKVGRKFSSVLIVCGTYTIGKEKFFLGMARRVGCGVWACPEKDRVLQAVEGRSFSSAPPQHCQLHVVPMRDLTHEKLREYLTRLQGAFTEVVAFKPSGWENGKNLSLEKDSVTIHGIPYSEHSSFSEMIRFVKFLNPKQIVPTVDISGGIKSVQKYFPCPLVTKDSTEKQSRLTHFYSPHLQIGVT